MSAKMVIVFATPIGVPSSSIEVDFPTPEEALEVSLTLRVGATDYPWISYVDDEGVATSEFPDGMPTGDVVDSTPGQIGVDDVVRPG
jgi:hypothetical protein